METTLNVDDRQRLIFRLLFFLFILYLAVMSLGTVVYGADDGESILKLLQSYEIDSQTGMVPDAARYLGYSLMKGIGAMVDGLYKGISEIYSLLSFGSSKPLTDLVTRYSVLYKSLFIISVVFLGIYLLCSKGGSQLNTVNCIILIGMVLVAMPLFTQTMSNLTVNSTKYVQGQWVQVDNKTIKSIASTIIADNVVDLKKVDKNVSGTKIDGLEKDKGFNDLTVGSDKWRYIDINTPMDPEKQDLSGDFWEKKLEDKDGKTELTELNGFFDFLDTYYYRYQVTSWFNLFGLMLAVIIVLFFACVKCAKIVIEVAMAMVYLPFIATTDIAGGQRIKEAIKHFITLFCALFLCVALLGVYFAGFSYINAEVKSTFTKLLMQIALAWAIIDGPNIIERILGIDVGLKSGWQMVMGARAAGSMAAAGGKMAARTATTAAGAGVKAGAMASKMAIGKEGMKKAAAVKGEAKKKAADAAQKATGGYGVAGAMKNAGAAVKEKMDANGSGSSSSQQHNAEMPDPNMNAAVQGQNMNAAAQESTKKSATVSGVGVASMQKTSKGTKSAGQTAKTGIPKVDKPRASAMPHITKNSKANAVLAASKTAKQGKPGIAAISQGKQTAAKKSSPMMDGKPMATGTASASVPQKMQEVNGVASAIRKQAQRSAVQGSGKVIPDYEPQARPQMSPRQKTSTAQRIASSQPIKQKATSRPVNGAKGSSSAGQIEPKRSGTKATAAKPMPVLDGKPMKKGGK